MSAIRSILLFYFALLSTSATAQNYAPVDQYLIDSLDLSAISNKDKQLIDSALNLYQQCKSPVCQAGAISLIVEASWDINVWPRYNRWVHDFASNQLATTNLDSATRQNLSISYAGALNNIGYLFNAYGQTDSALYYYDRCLEIQKEIDDKSGMSGTYINTGYIFLNQGLIEKALEYYYNSLKLEEELGNQAGVARALNGIGFIQYKQGDSEGAKTNHVKSLQIRRALNDEYGMATSLNNIGLVYKDNEAWQLAIEHFEEAMALQEKIDDQAGVAISLVNLGFVYNELGQMQKAEEVWARSLAISTELQDKRSITSVLNNLAQLSLSRRQLSRARTRAARSLEIAQELNYPQSIRDASETLTEISKRQGRWQEALGHHERYVQMKDSVFNQETVTASIHEQYRYRYQQQAMADSIRSANAQALQDAENARLQVLATKRRQTTYFLVIGILLSLAFVWTLLNRVRKVREQKQKIERQNEELAIQKTNLSDFAHSVSHDLRTPINGIIGMMNLIELEHPDLIPELKEKLKLVGESAQQSSDLVSGVLAYSEAGRENLVKQEVDLNDLIPKIVSELPNENLVQIEYDLQLPSLTANDFQLRQIFSNLLNNAIRYNNKPKGQGRVILKYETKGIYHRFDLVDNGPGIAPEMHQRVFELFGKSKSSSGQTSSGIGLSIVRKLLEQNGGDIALESANGQGAKFSFIWPR